jgi:hypothetical protein
MMNEPGVFSEREGLHITPQSNLSPRKRKVPGQVGTGPGRRRKGRNASAIERTIAALRGAGRLVDADAGSLAAVRTTAIALDDAAGAYDIAVIARVHLAALGGLLAGHQAPPDDELDRFLLSLRSPEVRDSPKP